MNVKELIEILQKFPQDRQVIAKRFMCDEELIEVKKKHIKNGSYWKSGYDDTYYFVQDASVKGEGQVNVVVVDLF